MKVRWVIHLKRRAPRTGNGPWRVVMRYDGDGAPWAIEVSRHNDTPLLFSTEAEAGAAVPSVQHYYGSNFIAYAGARRVP